MHTNPHRLGTYELRSLIGRAGMVEIWLAYDSHSQLDVSIKLFRPDLTSDPDFLKRFEQEARLAAALHHPNIVQVRNFQIVSGPQKPETIAYLVMDTIQQGQPLVDYLAATSGSKKFPAWETVVRMFSPLCAAIDYAHRQGMIHHNINPTNILLDKRITSHNPAGEPMLTDFGVATILGITSSPRPGVVQGNPHYLAPEQIQGYRGNELSDIYSLGVILYQICTGVLPFQGNNKGFYTTSSKQRGGNTPQPPGLFNPTIPPPLTLVLLRALKKEPAERFPTATALASAVAEALNIFVSENAPVSTADTMNLPTYLTTADPDTLSVMNSSTPSLSVVGTPSSPSDRPSAVSGADIILATPLTPVTMDHEQRALPITPADEKAANHMRHTPSAEIADLPTLAISKPTVLLPAPSKPTGKRLRFIMALTAILILLLGSIALGAFYVLPRIETTAKSPSGPAIVGHAFFLNSGHVNPKTNQGLNDGLQLTLQHIAAPAPGKSYYVWLLNDTGTNAGSPMLLGTLSIVQSKGTLTYKDKKYTNLLANFNRLVITEGDANNAATSFPQNTSTWKYTALLSQTTNGTTKVSLLDHLRYLLSSDPQLDALGLHGGLTIWFAKNIEAITIWAGSARDDWNNGGNSAIRPQLIRILDVLDSAGYVRGDVPPGTALEINVPVALLTFDAQTQKPPGYAYQINSNLTAISNALGATAAQIQLAKSISRSLKNVTNWLKQVHTDALQLLQMNNAQMQSQASLSILNDMAAQALYAYVGQLDPATNQVVQGATQIYDTIQHLVTFTITPYTGKQG
jgi:serine/threonine protein kinase